MGTGYCYVRTDSPGISVKRKDSLVAAARMSRWREAQEALQREAQNLRRFQAAFQTAPSHDYSVDVSLGEFQKLFEKTEPFRCDWSGAYHVISKVPVQNRFYGGGKPSPSLLKEVGWVGKRSGHRIVYLYAEPESDIESEFNELAERWFQEVGAESSLTKITGNINYLRIIALGKPVLPLILKRLQREPAPWFLALSAISGELEIAKKFPGDFRKISQAWLKWGRNNGYI